VVEVLIEEARQHEDMGAIGPRILDLEGKDQSPMNYCNIWKRIIIPYGFFPFIYPFLAFFSDIVPKATFNAYYRLMGCFVIVKADVFMDVGAFDEGTFLYAEEMILSERMKRLGKKMYFNPNVALIHAHGQVIGKSIGRLRAMHLRIKSELYFYRKYIGVSKLEEILSRLTVILFVKCYYPILKLIKNCLIEYRI
jgi:GT2 family glycosyltransferase